MIAPLRVGPGRAAIDRGRGDDDNGPGRAANPGWECVSGWCRPSSSKRVGGLETGSRWVRFPCIPAILSGRGGAASHWRRTPMLLAIDDIGPGPAVVLIHGFPLDRSMWEAQTAEVGSIYRIIAPDLRGAGSTAGARRGLHHRPPGRRRDRDDGRPGAGRARRARRPLDGRLRRPLDRPALSRADSAA